MVTVAERKLGALTYVCLKRPAGLDLNKTFDCGQCFRFERVEGSPHEAEFFGIAYGRAVSFATDGDLLYIYNSTAEELYSIWQNYLALEVDYSEIDKSLATCTDSEAFKNAMEYGSGIRILNQEPYEALISFIISQNNNIPRIKQIIERLCRSYGEKIDLPEEMEAHISDKLSLYSFPTAEALNSIGVEGIFAAKTGFRAKYIYDATEKLLSGQLDPALPIGMETTDEGVEYLCRVKGVGPKVASCILLFSCRRYDAFPVDVWIKRAMEKYFGTEAFTPRIFGKYAGIAQQYLFYYERYNVGNK